MRLFDKHEKGTHAGDVNRPCPADEPSATQYVPATYIEHCNTSNASVSDCASA